MDTILVSVGRNSNSKGMALDKAGVEMDEETFKIFGRKDERERTNI